MRYSLLLLIFLLGACGMHKNIQFIKNEPIMVHEAKSKHSKTGEIQSSIEQRNATSESNEEIWAKVDTQSYTNPQLPAEKDAFKISTPTHKEYEINSDADPNNLILQAAKENERKARTSLGLSITSLVLDFIFPYLGIPLTIVAGIYFLIINQRRYFTVKGDRMMRTSMILLLIQAALILAVIALITLLILFF